MPHVTGHPPHGGTAFTNSNVVGSGYAGGPTTKPKTPAHHVNLGQPAQSALPESVTWGSMADEGKKTVSPHGNWTKTNDNKGDANKSNTNWSTASYPDPDPENDAFSNEINYSNQQNVSKTIDEWQLNNDKTNTFFTGGGTLINSKDKPTQDLYTAGSDILNALGLDNNKKNMQIALNILQGGDRIWGKTSRALQNATQAQINAITLIKGQDIGATGKWNTWGTNLRGDATWGGSPTSQEDYQDKMTIFSGNWDAGSPLYKYQQMLVDNWQSANPNYKNSGSNKLGAALLTAMVPMNPAMAGFVFGAKGLETAKGNLSKPTNLKEFIKNPLGAIIPQGWIADPKEGIKSLHINGQEVTINNKTINRGDGGVFSKYDLAASDLGRDSGTDSSAPYYNSSFNIEQPVTIEEEEEKDTGQSENTLTADENPAWWNFKLFETIFSPLSSLKYNEGDIVTEENKTVAPEIVRNIVKQAQTDNQAKMILKNLVEENEQIANVVNTYEDIKKSVNDLIGPIEISADVDDLTVQAETPKGFIAKADLQDKEFSIEKELGNLNLKASYNPEKQSGFLGLQKAF